MTVIYLRNCLKPAQELRSGKREALTNRGKHRKHYVENTNLVFRKLLDEENTIRVKHDLTSLHKRR